LRTVAGRGAATAHSSGRGGNQQTPSEETFSNLQCQRRVGFQCGKHVFDRLRRRTIAICVNQPTDVADEIIDRSALLVRMLHRAGERRQSALRVEQLTAKPFGMAEQRGGVNSAPTTRRAAIST
jgi:hypothetical protein